MSGTLHCLSKRSGFYTIILTTVIGPSAFNNFINDIFHVTNNSTIYNHANDNILSCSAKTYDDLKSILESKIVNISKLFDVNGMISNPDKFRVIIFGSSNELEYLNVQGHLIKCQKVVKHLGVLTDNKLDFNNHIDHICKKTGQQVNAYIDYVISLMKKLK